MRTFRILYVVPLFLASVVSVAATGGQLAEMENETLLRAFDGWTVPGYSERAS